MVQEASAKLNITRNEELKVAQIWMNLQKFQN